MVKSSRQHTRMIRSDANRFVGRSLPRCSWPGCDAPPFPGIPVCLTHGFMISDHLQKVLSLKRDDDISLQFYDVDDDGVPLPPRRGFVYYLMIGPSTVKIGTTKNLLQRLNALRTDLQYVVAIEPGGYSVESQRHRQFDSERIGRREDFRLSDRLKQHIDELSPNRDEFVSLATN